MYQINYTGGYQLACQGDRCRVANHRDGGREEYRGTHDECVRWLASRGQHAVYGDSHAERAAQRRAVPCDHRHGDGRATDADASHTTGDTCPCCDCTLGPDGY